MQHARPDVKPLGRAKFTQVRTLFRGWRRQRPTSTADVVDFRSQPYVCGAIGRFDEAHLDRLRRGSPTNTREVHRSETAVLFASNDLYRWRTGTGEGFLWNALSGDEQPTSWQAAAERRSAAGLHVSAEEATLHTDAVGFQDVYTRRIGTAIYFSIRVDPLVRLTDTKLHTDWTAWATIYAVTSPLSDRTPFEEIQRMSASTAWVAGRSGIRQSSFEPEWLSAEPGGMSPGDAAATVERCLPARGNLGITLTGGVDSRLLAAVLRRVNSDPIVAWTTSGDDGRDRDLELVGPVASALGMEQRTVVPNDDAWHKELTTVRRRVEYQTTHHVWFMPLARVLQARPETFLDGLAGESFKAHGLTTEKLAAAADPGSRHRLMWDSLSQGRFKDPNRLARGLAASFEERSRESLVESVTRFDGHPAAWTLSRMHTRVTRAIAQSPLRLMAPETKVSVPFVHPDIIDAALRVPVVDKVGGAFYRDMLVAANPQVAALPSTSDPGMKGKRGPQRQTRPAALRAMVQTIRGSEAVVGILGPEFRQALDDVETLHRLGRTLQGHRVLNWASLFAEWRTTYADVLADDAPA